MKGPRGKITLTATKLHYNVNLNVIPERYIKKIKFELLQYGNLISNGEF